MIVQVVIINKFAEKSIKFFQRRFAVKFKGRDFSTISMQVKSVGSRAHETPMYKRRENRALGRKFLAHRNQGGLTNFDAHARPNRIYVVDVCSVLTSFRVIFQNGKKEERLGSFPRLRQEHTGTTGTKLEFTRRDVATRLSVRRSPLIKSLDPS